MTEAVRFFVPGRPVPWARAGQKGRQKYTPPRQRAQMDIIRHHATEAMKEFNGGIPVKGPVWVIISFCYDAGPDKVMPRTGRPDWDNLGKLVCDACNGVVYEDDAQIVSATVHKWTLKGHTGTRCMFWFTRYPFEDEESGYD